MLCNYLHRSYSVDSFAVDIAMNLVGTDYKILDSDTVWIVKTVHCEELAVD